MNKYTIEITETLKKTVTIQAETASDAYDLVENMYNNEEIVLDSTDYAGVDYQIVEINSKN